MNLVLVLPVEGAKLRIGLELPETDCFRRPKGYRTVSSSSALGTMVVPEHSNAHIFAEETWISGKQAESILTHGSNTRCLLPPRKIASVAFPLPRLFLDIFALRFLESTSLYAPVIYL